LFSSLCFAQGAQQSTATEVPVENEPHHHLVFENEYVRVFKVEVAPHEATLVHRHKRDYVVVTIGDAEVTNAVVGREPKKWSFKDGDVTFLEATGEKSFAHKAVNESDKPFVNLTIELKSPGSTEHDSTVEKLDFGQRRYFKGYAITESTLFGAHTTYDRGMIADSFGSFGGTFGRALVVTLSSFEVSRDQRKLQPMKPGDWRWFDSPTSFYAGQYSSKGSKLVEIRKDYW
jgi:hypothetical protein